VQIQLYKEREKMIKESDLKKLNLPTPKEERKYREGFRSYDGTKSTMLCYVDARYVMDALDKHVGSGNWDNEYFEIKGNLFCKITIRFEKEDGSIGETFKMDCGVESNVEKQKGESSDAFKRAAVHFGIARDLYNLPKYVCELDSFVTKQGETKYYVPKGWKPKEDK
tara:strand:- start:2629 stop:3129 length:501 start_codon:yes stop_codon:yes gene_type:complete